MGQWRDRGAVAAWQAQTAAANALREQHAAHKRIAGDEELLRALEGLRRIYHRSIGTSRKLAIELVLLNALRAPLDRRR